MKLIVFDLDWTLAISKSKLDLEIAEMLKKIIDNYFLAIISWWDYPQFEMQFLSQINFQIENKENLFLLPTCWTKFFRFKSWIIENIYSDEIEEQERKKIISIIKKIYNKSKYYPKKIYWELIEDRKTQITLSALWQEAPIKEKEKWDKNYEKRKDLISKIKPLIWNYSINFWWTTSIDITKKWIDKSFWIKKLMEITWVNKEDILFVWDALYEWWNDYPVKEMWVKSIQTSGPEETKKIIKKYLNI